MHDEKNIFNMKPVARVSLNGGGLELLTEYLIVLANGSSDLRMLIDGAGATVGFDSGIGTGSRQVAEYESIGSVAYNTYVAADVNSGAIVTVYVDPDQTVGTG